MPERIGILGLGRMGHAMALRLSGSEFTVAGWTRSGESRNGVEQEADPESLVAVSDIVLLSLLNEAAVNEILTRIAGADLSGKLIVEMSTVPPSLVREAEDRITHAGGRLIDAPVSGGPDLVAAGRAGLYVGGEADDVARFMPIAEALAGRVVHVGGLGNGAAAKLLNNQLLCGFWEALCEVIALGKGLGLGYETMIDLLADSPGATPAMKGRLPVIRGEDETVGFPVSGGEKDAGVILSVARGHGIETPALEACHRRFREAVEAGEGEKDLATVVPRAFGTGR